MQFFILFFFFFFADYLCEPDANIYDIEFTRFKIRDLDTDQILFEIAKPPAGKWKNFTFQFPLSYWLISMEKTTKHR